VTVVRRDVLRALAAGACLLPVTAGPLTRRNTAPVRRDGIPDAAAKAGFETIAFYDDFESLSSIDMANSQAPGFKWYRTSWFTGGRAALDASNISIANGILRLGGGTGEAGYGLVSAFDNHKGTHTGTIFANGGYFEASIRYDPYDCVKATTTGPAFWSIAIEHIIDNSASSVAQWPGQPLGYAHFIELDFMEPLIPPGKPYRGSTSYQGNIHDWYGPWNDKTRQWTNNISNRSNDVIWVGSVDWNEFHVYGTLWVPQSNSTPGHVTWFFDGQEMASVYWLGRPGFPPLPGEKKQNFTPSSARNAATTYSILDTQHLAISLSTELTWPMEVDWVKVWK
jgi:hypothetical protein